jgi:metal-responsive CopG/Arc/MetJ family transcriptional regulator
MRTTVELQDDHRAQLMELAARRGEKGFSRLLAEALEGYFAKEHALEEKRRRVLRLRGVLSDEEAAGLRATCQEIREFWR